MRLANRGTHDVNVTYHMISFLHAIYDIFVCWSADSAIGIKLHDMKACCDVLLHRFVIREYLERRFSPTFALL